MSTASAKPRWIVETSPESFSDDVLEQSKRVPVVVDFWAPWCAPCRALGPILEKLATDYGGRFILVKADTEKVPQQAADFGVQSIPAVYGVRDGKIVDYFMGLVPETQLRVWLDQFLPTEAQNLTAEATRLVESDPATAEHKYREAMRLDSNEAAAPIGLAKLLLSQDRQEESRQLIVELERRGFLEPEAEKIRAALDLQDKGQRTGGIEECRAAAMANPDDLNLQFRLAEALAAVQRYNEALPICLDLVSRDRKGIGESARQVMVNIFRLLPDDSPLTSTYRRKLSMALY